jgi:hypothetical protein
MGFARANPGKSIRKTAIALTEYEKVSFWLNMPLRDFFEWIQDVIELIEERRKKDAQ